MERFVMSVFHRRGGMGSLLSDDPYDMVAHCFCAKDRKALSIPWGFVDRIIMEVVDQ
jgi:hypothetical protein